MIDGQPAVHKEAGRLWSKRVVAQQRKCETTATSATKLGALESDDGDD